MTVSVTCPQCRSALDITPPGGWCVDCDCPVLLGRSDGSHLAVWCPHCERDHHHGRHDPATGCRYDNLRPGLYPCTCPLGTGDGHRVAHCHTDRSPYDDTGYIVVEYR